MRTPLLLPNINLASNNKKIMFGIVYNNKKNTPPLAHGLLVFAD